MKKLLAGLAAGLVADALAFSSWTGKGEAGVFNDPKNWGGGNPAYLDFETAGAKGTTGDVIWDANLQGMPTGTYTLNADIVINRLNFDAANRHPIINLNGHTLTAISKESAAALGFRGTSLATGDSLVLTNGTFLVPTSPYKVNDKSYTLGNNFVSFGYDQDGYPNNITLTVTGENTLLKSKAVVMSRGIGHTFNVENGATVETVLYCGDKYYQYDETSAFVGHTVRLDGGTYKHTGDGVAYSIGRSAGCTNHTLVLANGGKVLDKNGREMHIFNIGGVTGGSGHRLVVEGTSEVTITNRPSIPAANCANCGLTVRQGGKVIFESDVDSFSRFWLGGSSKTADILVTGEGSFLETKSGSPALIGQSGPDCVLRVTDKAVAKLKYATIGASRGASCSNNRMVADNGGEIRLETLAIGGQNNYDSDDGSRSVSNRLEIVDGGRVVLAASDINLGSRPYAYRNGIYVSGEGSSLTNVKNLVLAGSEYTDNAGEHWLDVRDGGRVFVDGWFRTATRHGLVRLSGGAVTCATAMLTNGVSLVIGCDKDKMPTKPLLKATDTIYLGRHNYVAGAAKDVVSISMAEGSTIAEDGELVVLEAKTLKVDSDVVAAFNATLPEGFKARVRDNRLTVLHEKGLCLIFR